VDEMKGVDFVLNLRSIAGLFQKLGLCHSAVIYFFDMRLKALIVICCVAAWLHFAGNSSSGAEQLDQAMPPVASESVPASSISFESSRWSFVVFGDTRDALQNTQRGISPLLGRIAERIAAEKPALVIHTGDLINGYYTGSKSPVHGKYEEMFDNWKAAVRPIYDFERRSGIPLYVVRGNHEDGKMVTDERLKAAYVKNIASFMPQNGPLQEKGLTYSVSYQQATFIAVDEYSIRELGLLRGLVNQPWLDEQLVLRRAPFMFVFGHVPAFKVSARGKGPFPDLYDFPEHRDTFWNSLKEAGVDMYFCGHVHFYCRVTKNSIQQVLVGNGGANVVDFDPKEVDPTTTLNYPTTFMKASDVKAGYVLVTVDESAHTITAVQKLWNEERGVWETGDSFATQHRTDRR
jgi:hypothetical protein